MSSSNPNLQMMDPFLYLVHGYAKLPSGFPDHPHRGFETLSYIVKGEINHEDSTGRAGILREGGAQLMTAGKGVLHSELPNSFDHYTDCFQLWINLPKIHKYCEPVYQEQQAEEIPTYQDENMTAKVVAGQVFNVKSTFQQKQPIFWIDFTFHKENAEYFHIIPKQWNSLIYVLEGSLIVQDSDQVINRNITAQFKQASNDQYLKFNVIEKGTRFILLAGQPLNEPIAWEGPFLMNEESEIKKAFDDFQHGKNGFESSRYWASQNQHIKIRNKSL